MNITFIMAVYNAEATIAESIDCLINQTSSNWNLICVDDGSSDNSVKIIEQFVDNDNRILLLKQENAGPAMARSMGISFANTEYIGILDSDDKLSLDFVELSLHYIEKYKADIVVPDLIDFGLKHQGFSRTLFERMNEYEGMQIIGGKQSFLMALDWHFHGCAVFEASLMKKYYTKDNASYSRFNSDEYITRILYYKCKKVVLSSAKYYYRMSDTSITKKSSLKMLERIDTGIKMLDFVVAEHMGNQISGKMYSDAMFLILYMMKFIRNFDYSDRIKGRQFIQERYKVLHHRFRMEYLKGMPTSVVLKISLLNLGFFVPSIFCKFAK